MPWLLGRIQPVFPPVGVIMGEKLPTKCTALAIVPLGTPPPMWEFKHRQPQRFAASRT